MSRPVRPSADVEIHRVLVVRAVRGLGTEKSICRNAVSFFLLRDEPGAKPEHIYTDDPCPESEP